MFLKKDFFFCKVKSANEKYLSGELSPYIEEESYAMTLDLQEKFESHKHLLSVVTMEVLGLKKPSYANLKRAEVFNDRIQYCILLLDIALEETRPARKFNGKFDVDDMTSDMRKTYDTNYHRHYT